MKSLIRFLFSVYLWTAVALVTFLVSSLILLSAPLALFDRSRRLAHGLGTLWAEILIRLNPYWRLKITGQRKIQKNQGYVLVSNHLSLSDIICLFTLHHHFKWLAKRSLFSVPFLGWAMGAMGYIPLERGRHGSIRASYQEALGWLKRNVSVLIFPEGTRSRTGEMGKFKSGAFRLAIEAGGPIVPIVLAGTHQIISKGKSSFGTRGVAYLSVLPPLHTNDLKPGDGVSYQVKRLRNSIPWIS